MGKIAGVFLSEGSVKTVFLRGGKLGYTLERVEEGIPTAQKLSGYRVYLTYLYTDLISETVQIPPVKDEETRNILLKKQLVERIGSLEDLLIVYSKAEVTPEGESYRVFGIPANLYTENPLIPNWLRESSEIFTLPQFALASVSAHLYPEFTVFHVYADRSTLIMVVSKGEEIVYTRSIAIPSYIEDEDLDTFLHENVSMTFMFVVQRQGINVNVVLLSGGACREGFIKELLESTPAGMATPLVPPVFKNTSPETFHGFLPAFGAVLVKEEYDFSPPEVKERRRIGNYIKKGLVLTTLLLLVCSGGIAYRAFLIAQELQILKELNKALLHRTEELLKEPLIRDNTLSYYLSYVNLIGEVRQKNPLRLLTLAADLVTDRGVKKIVLGRREDKAILLLELERKFPGLVELTIFREQLLRRLKELEGKGVGYRVEREDKDLKENRLKINLRLEWKL